ncbi:hypothetical protein CEP67_11965 [Staphylococcus pettenkoferi]|nr:hypothetical protein CEP67_11965 [Staphylococcus pettenkoferi]
MQQNNQEKDLSANNQQVYQNQQATQQPPVNKARQQAINEGIDFDNPTDEEIERMRELSKQSPYGLQEPTQMSPNE